MDTLSTPLDFIASNTALLAMWGALIAHWFFPSLEKKKPFATWHILAETIAEKVNHRSDSPEQQKLAGALSLAILWLSTAALLIAFQQLFWVSGICDLVFLWLALSFKPVVTLAQNVELALIDEDKPKARQYLAHFLNRDTLSLSKTGISKACCETLIFGYFRGLFAVLFWYCLAGPITALLYTLLVQLARNWTPRLEQFQQFGKPTHQLLICVEALPIRLFSLMIAIGTHFNTTFNAIKQQAPKWTEAGKGWLLASSGTKYQLSLGGSVIYDDIRFPREKIGGRIAPSAIHIAYLNQALQKKLGICLFLFSLLLGITQGS